MLPLFRSSPFGSLSDSIPSVRNYGYLFDSKEGIRRSALIEDNDLLQVLDKRLDTIHALLTEAVRICGNREFLGSHSSPTEPYSWMTYSEIYNRARDFGSGLIHVGELKTNGSSFVGVYGRNCRDWLVTEFSCCAYNMVTIPLYDTLGVEALKHICLHSDISICVCVTPDRVRSLLQLGLPLLKHLIIIFPGDELELLKKEAGKSVQIHTVDEILIAGKENRLDFTPSSPDDQILICYTSGTTGLPKGVIITNKMLVATVAGCLLNSDLRMFTSQDTHLSYLPLPHIFEQFNVMLSLTGRGRIGFYAGDLTQLQQDALILQPTVFIAVPRVLARIRQKIYRQVADSKFKLGLLNTAIRQKLKVVNKQIYHHNTMWDQLIFGKFRKRFGGRIRLIISAGAPISPELLQFVRAAFCCPVLEGYGSTETCGAITSSIFGDLKGGHVGPPLPECEIKLCDVPELGLIASRDNKGEVCCRGVVCTPGYYKDEALTKSLIDDDGWLHTGDVGIWTEDHCLKIVDRLKHIFKLSQGEYIAPEKIEAVYYQSQYVTQVFVDGCTLRSYPVGIVVPDGQILALAIQSVLRRDGMSFESRNHVQKKKLHSPASGDNNVDSGLASTEEKFFLRDKEVTLCDLCSYPEAERIILDDFTQLGRIAGLKGFEQVRAIYLLPEPFSVENRLLTPTMKCARHAIRQKYQTILNELFENKNLD